MNKALIVGGTSGIGLALTLSLLSNGYEHIYIVGKEMPDVGCLKAEQKEIFEKKVSIKIVNLINCDYEFLNEFEDINTLIITAGFGRVAPFEELNNAEIDNLIKCNMLSAIKIIKYYYDKIRSNDDFYCAVLGSISGHISSPLFSVYGATKSGLCRFIESVNAELAHDGYNNRILDVSPGSLKGTNFNGRGNDITQLEFITGEVLKRMYNRQVVYIPQYEEVYKNVLERYHADSLAYGIDSYDYKIKSGRISTKPQLVVGYLSGTFDLFHIGHLNLLRCAKEQCDYLIVGVHQSGKWKGKETFIPFEERLEIVGNIKYVDKVVESFVEDADAYDVYKYDKLFVGSDYKGTERFNRYEEYFKDKGVEIIYFPYTQGTSSTKLREAISRKKDS